MIQITFIDGAYREWDEDQYTDYMVNKDLFVILKDSQWIGIYNLKTIKEIVVDA